MWGMIIAGIVQTALNSAITGLKVYSTLQAGKFNRDMYRYQAKLNDQRATRAQQTGQIEAEEAALRKRQLVGSGKTAFAGNGMLVNGNANDASNLWEQDQMAELAYEQASIADAANAEAWGFSTQAAMDRAHARFAMKSAKLQAWMQFFEGGSKNMSDMSGMMGGAGGGK